MKAPVKRQNGDDVIRIDEKRSRVDKGEDFQQHLNGSNRGEPKIQPPQKGLDQVTKCHICLWPVNSPQCYHSKMTI